MTLPSSGLISLADIAVELGKSSSAAISLNDSDVRALAGRSSGAISFSDLHGKSAVQREPASGNNYSYAETSSGYYWRVDPDDSGAAARIRWSSLVYSTGTRTTTSYTTGGYTYYRGVKRATVKQFPEPTDPRVWDVYDIYRIG